MPKGTLPRGLSKTAVILQLVVSVGLVYSATVAVTGERGLGTPFLDVLFLIVAVGLLLFALFNALQLRRDRSRPADPERQQGIGLRALSLY